MADQLLDRIERDKTDARQRVGDLDSEIEKVEKEHEAMIAEQTAKKEARLSEVVSERKALAEFLASVESGPPAPAEEEQEEPEEAPAPAPARRGRPRQPRGSRGDQFVQVVADNPGITVSEVARRMKIKPNYLYRIAQEREEAGEVRKDANKQYFPSKELVTA